jgi:hypothetical protein
MGSPSASNLGTTAAADKIPVPFSMSRRDHLFFSAIRISLLLTAMYNVSLRDNTETRLVVTHI